MKHAEPFPQRWGVASLLLLAVLLLWEASGADLWGADLLYQRWGFPGRDSWWLETVLHRWVKYAVLVLFAALLGLWLWLLRPGGDRLWRWRLGYLLLAAALASALVPLLKAATGLHCPADLQRYGGAELFRPLWSLLPQDARPGRCWPGGHASTGFVWLAGYFALWDRWPRTARKVLGAALALGALLSWGRMVQGAHFLSHNLWTLWIDWSLALLLYRLLLWPRVSVARVPRPAALPGQRRAGRAELGLPETAQSSPAASGSPSGSSGTRRHQ